MLLARRLLFNALQWLLMRVVRFKSFPADANVLVLALGQPVFYALHIRQLSALLVLDEAVRQLGLPAATRHFRLSESNQPDNGVRTPRIDERSTFFFLTRRGQPSPLQRNPYRYSDRLMRLVQALASTPESSFDIQIVPVSIFWGRSPTHQDSVFKALFADNWVTPGFFSQTVRLLIHGRQTFLKFGAPISLRSTLAQSGVVNDGSGDVSVGIGSSGGIALRRIARLLRAEFKRERELAIGPNLSHRQTLVNSVIGSAQLQQSIQDEAARNHQTVDVVELRARKIAVEIASDYSYPFIRAYDRALSALWNRIYDGIEVHGFDEIAKAGAGAQIIYLPCHRSHIDYLLLSYMIYHKGLLPPHVAAGDNLNMPVVGGLLRRGGAFFLRRSFKGDALYGDVFREYLHTIIERGFPIEYFVEGGRSRTGRMLAPKAGLLAMTVASWQRDGSRPIVFIPVYIGYERVIEGETYFAELSGQPKKRESVLGLFRALGSLREHFGKVHVNIGEPVRIDDFVSRDQQDDDVKPAVARLADTIVTRINSALVVNPINLLALALTSRSRSAMDEIELGQLIDQLKRLLQQVPYSDRQQVSPMTGAQVIAYAKLHKLVNQIEHPLGNIIETSAKQTVMLSYFRNNVMHAFVVPALIAALIARNDVMERDLLRGIVANLYPFLRADWFLWREAAHLDAYVEQVLDCLLAMRLLRSSGSQLSAPAAQEIESAALHQLAGIVQQPLERYYLVVTTLARLGSARVSSQELENTCFLLAQRIAFLHPARTPEFFDRNSIRTIIATLQQLGQTSQSDGLLDVSEPLLAAAHDARYLLSAETRLALSHVAALSQDDILKAQSSLTRIQ